MTDLPNENRQKLSSLEVCVAKVEQKLDDIVKDVAKIDDKLDKVFDNMDKRYASKRTEQLFYSTLGAVIVYIVCKVIDLL